jgi:hypothetical protein
MRRSLLTAALLALAVGTARADFNVEVTAPPGFADGLTRVVVIAVACHESVDCAQVEDTVAEELANNKPPFKIVPPGELRKELFARGATAWSEDLRPAVLEKLQADGVFEIRVPFANRGDGFGGRRRSEVRVEVRLVTRDGALRLSGRGSGRPQNVVSGTERVAGTVIEKILEKVFSGR